MRHLGLASLHHTTDWEDDSDPLNDSSVSVEVHLSHYKARVHGSMPEGKYQLAPYSSETLRQFTEPTDRQVTVFSHVVR